MEAMQLRPEALAKPVADEVPFRKLGERREPEKAYRLAILHGMPSGARRRQEILQYLMENGSLSINRSGCLQSTDPDIRILLKKGLVVCERDMGGRARYIDAAGNPQMRRLCRTTRLVLKPKEG